LRVAIIGAGFSGLIFSKYLLKSNIDVDLFEEHKFVGMPEHCTGIVSSLTERLIGDEAEKNRLSQYNGLNISGTKEKVYLSTRDPVIKLNRKKLEEDLLYSFIKNGGRDYLSTKVDEISDLSRNRYDAIIIADGVNGFLHKMVGLGFKGRIVYGINQEFCIRSLEDHFTVKFDRVTSNNFFSWYVPLKDKVILGTGVENQRELMSTQYRLKKLYNIDKKEYKTYGGLIISGVNKSLIRKNNIFVIGDAAGMNKPLTGGGLYPNALSAYLTYVLIKKGFNLLESLESSIKFTLALLFKSNHLSIALQRNPEIVDELIDIIKKSGLINDINRNIDYDFHFDIIYKSIRSRNSHKFLYNFFKKDPIKFFKLSKSLIKDIT
jgi:flavin-dependent dehydrogenase